MAQGASFKMLDGYSGTSDREILWWFTETGLSTLTVHQFEFADYTLFSQDILV